MTEAEQLFMHWIEERHRVYLRREAGAERPYTDDRILATYRFCNVYRQLDRVTVWLNEHWFPGVPRRRLPWMALVARLINDPDPLHDLRAVCMASRFDPWKFVHVLEQRKEQGLSVRSGAYIVSTNGHDMPLPAYLATKVLTVDMPEPEVTLEAYYRRIVSINGIGSFIAGQIIADLKYHHPVAKVAKDWHTFVVPGPGSKRGLNRLHGRDPKAPMSDKAFARDFPKAQVYADTVAHLHGWSRIHAQDAQNCLCEFDKYMRVHGGTPYRRKFV